VGARSKYTSSQKAKQKRNKNRRSICIVSLNGILPWSCQARARAAISDVSAGVDT
jgi:hypothetical protein